MMSRFLRLAVFSLLIMLCFNSSLQAQSELSGVTSISSTIYTASNKASPIIGEIPAPTPVVVEGREDLGHWLLVKTSDDALRGWMVSSYLMLPSSVSLLDIPVSNETIESPEVVVQPTPTALPVSADVLNDIERLKAKPIFSNMITPQVLAIFQHGLELGNRTDIFTKVGDSNTTSGDFLQPMGLGKQFCELGNFAYLQDTIDFFSVSSPRSGYDNSFTSTSLAADNGLSSASALDPFWAGDECQSGESPLQCEFRVSKPSVAIIMLGLMDVRYSNEEFYGENMEEIVKVTIEQGVIPVLNTIIVLPDQETLSFDASITMNIALLDIAEKYQIPLINLWSAVQSLPGYGIGPDRTHLKHEVGKFCAFDGSEQEIGGTLHNLLTLQALDELRRNILSK